jgi:hypothetical protein
VPGQTTNYPTWRICQRLNIWKSIECFWSSGEPLQFLQCILHKNRRNFEHFEQPTLWYNLKSSENVLDKKFPLLCLK